MTAYARYRPPTTVLLLGGLVILIAPAITTGGSDGTPDQPPSWGALPMFAAVEGRPVTIDLAPFVSDPDTPLEALFLGCDASLGAIVSGLNATFTFATPGNATVIVHLSDGVSVVPAALCFTVEKADEPPKIKVVQLPDGELGAYYSFNLTAADPDDPPSDLSWSDDCPMFRISETGEIAFVPGLADIGYHSFKVTVTDPAGSSDTVAFTLFIVRGWEPPILAYISPQMAWANEVFTLDISQYVYDDGSDLLLPEEWRHHWVYRDDSTRIDTDYQTGVATWDRPTERDVGDFYFKVTVSDSKGRYAEQEIKITVLPIDGEPGLSIGPERWVDQGEVFELCVCGTRNIPADAAYLWSFNDSGAVHFLAGERVRMSLRDAGATRVTLTATWDDVSMSKSLLVHVRDSEPPSAKIKAPASAAMRELVTFDGKGSTDNVGVTSYQWTIRGGGVEAVLFGPVVCHGFDEAGTYLVLLEVEDAARHTAFDFGSILVTDTEPPVACAGQDVYVLSGAPVVLDGMNSTDNVGVIEYRWEVPGFGPVLAVGPVAVLPRPAPGDRLVRLTVKDAAGNVDIDEVMVSVAEEEGRDDGPPMDLAKVAFALTIVLVLLIVIAILRRMATPRRA